MDGGAGRSVVGDAVGDEETEAGGEHGGEATAEVERRDAAMVKRR